MAIRVLEHTRSLVNTKAPEDVKLMMIVNLASAYKHNKNSGKCVEVLDSIDWSASSDNYKLCVSALREDLQEFSRLMLLSANAGSVKKDHFKDWPVFNFVRKTKEFEDGFQTLFGESPRREEPTAAVEILEGDANIGSPEDKMVH